jgi:hypothetical protein
MIDWTKPVYDTVCGTLWFALRRPDGSVFIDSLGKVYAVAGKMSAGWYDPNDRMFTNTPPPQDWSHARYLVQPAGEDTLHVRYGRRNGKHFVEVVE